MVAINGERLLADLGELRTFGSSGTGVVRASYSDVDMEARRWLQSRMADAGLDANIDGIGNVFGRSRNDGPALIIGSHSDTQPTGGWLDGALGVIYGLEIARSLLENDDTASLAVDVVAWVDEEGTYANFVGSKSFCGVLRDDEMANATNAGGETISEALRRVGLVSFEPATIDFSRHVGYLEAHIEQGPILEDAGQKIGVVSSIVGIRGLRVTFSGQQNHAGTTPMNRRADAGVAMFDFAVRLRERLQSIAGPTTVWTIGTASLTPGAPSIIPGHAEFLLQFRDPENERLEAIERAVKSLAAETSAAGPVGVAVEFVHEPILPTEMDKGLTRNIAAAAVKRVPGNWSRMPSAAGHDPMVISDHLACGMLFIPSIGGVSHDFAEDSAEGDIITGCRVLADAAVAILCEATDAP